VKFSVSEGHKFTFNQKAPYIQTVWDPLLLLCPRALHLTLGCSGEIVRVLGHFRHFRWDNILKLMIY